MGTSPVVRNNSPCRRIFMLFVSRCFILLGVLFNVCLVSSGVQGQVAELPVAPVQRVPLDAIVLINEETGQRVITLRGDWSPEDGDRFRDFLLRDELESVPAFTIVKITALGNVVGNRVEAVLSFLITTQGDQMVRIPLGLKEGVLPFPSDDDVSTVSHKELPLPYQYVGPGVFDLKVSPQDGQYIGLIRNRERVKKDTEPPEHVLKFDIESEKPPSEPEQEKRRSKDASTEQRHELTLNLWFPLTGLHDEEQRLTISFPKAVGSQFRLSVPLAEATATVSPGTLLDTFFPDDGKTTQFTARGLRSNFEISWQKRKDDRREERPTLSVQDAAIIARLENHATLYDAVLPISSPIGFDRLFVRLPQDAVLDRMGTDSLSPSGEWTLRELSPDEKTAMKTGQAASVSDAAVYEVRFSRKATSQTLRLRAVQTIPTDKTGEFREINGFEILGAERQTGSLSLGIPSEMRPNWKPIRGLRRVELPPSPMQDGMEARFEFLTQPFLLRAQIVLPQTRINVKPEYQVQVSKGRLQLTAKFSYTVFGSKTDRIQLVFPDWRWIDIEPSNIVDLNNARQADDDNLLTIPLLVPVDGPFEIDLIAFQPISPEEDIKQRLTVRLPTPKADWIEPAFVVIVPDDNVELLPVDDETSSGLARKSRRTLPFRIDVPVRQQDALVFQTESASPVFVTDMLYHRQSVSVSVQNNVNLLDPDNQVTANLLYSIAYEPIDRVFLLVPKSIDRIGLWSVSLGEKNLEFRDVPPTAVDESSERWVKKRISLPPEAMIGNIPLTVRYSIPPVTIEHNSTAAAFSIPLVRPVEANVSNVDVNLSVRSGFRVELHGDVDGSWKPIENPPQNGTVAQRQIRRVGFSASKTPDRIPLLLSLEEREALGTTVIEKAWVQTWLTDRIRVDRGVYQLTSGRESISLHLPSGIGKELSVLLDGVSVAVHPTPKGELIVPLSVEQQLRPVLLDVLYQVDISLRSFVQMELPYFESGTVVRRVYWQLILPQYRHLVGVPTNWTPEYDWKWNGLFWGRMPSLSLDSIGFPDDPTRTPSTETSQYLFSSLSPPTDVSFYIANRSLIVLLSSSLSLLIGLALIYFPRCRYAGSLLGLGVALCATVLYRPAPVLLALQAASLGVFLALGAAYFYRLLNRQDRWTPTLRSPAAAYEVPEDVSEPSEVYPVIIDESDSKKDESGAKS